MSLPTLDELRSEKTVVIKTADTHPWVQFMVIGYEVAQLQRGRSLVVHLFDRTTSSGVEVMAGEYTRESARDYILLFAQHRGLALDVRIAGLDVVVTRRA